MTELVIEAHRRKTPIDHPYRSITREHLEYPTENVSFAYLSCINKVGGGLLPWSSAVLTKYIFTDKAVFSVVNVKDWGMIIGRYIDGGNFYTCLLTTATFSKDHCIRKYLDSKYTILAEESVDLSIRGEGSAISISGSTIKSLRWDTYNFLDPLNLPDCTAMISATDTDFQSGRFGYRTIRETESHGAVFDLSAYLLPPMTSLPSAIKIIEVEVTGSGTKDDPIRPDLRQELVKINKLTNIPEFLKQEAKRYEILKQKFTDEEIKALLGYIPQHQVDLASVTWGIFDHKAEHSTMLITITADNPYKEGAILKQVEYAKAKNLKVLNPPKDYREACEQYRQLRKDFTEWTAGKDNYAYQTLGNPIFEYFQVADTYHGRIIEMGDTKAYKDVPDWEMRKTLNMWKEKLERVNVLKHEAEKHLNKLKEVEKKGW